MVEVIGSVFTAPGCEGDFSWMIEQPDYADALFVFNDNEEQFLLHRDDPSNPAGCAAGGGNAVIRPWRCADPPRAVGVPTGTLVDGGYRALDDRVRSLVDDAVNQARGLAQAHGFRRLFYSSAGGDGALGTGIFEVDEQVKRYIMRRLRELEGSRCEPLC